MNFLQVPVDTVQTGSHGPNNLQIRLDTQMHHYILQLEIR